MRRSVIVAELWRPEVVRIGNFWRNLCVFFEKTTPYDKIFKILFGKFISRHRSTLLCAKFVKIVWREIGEACVIYLTKKTFFRLPLKLGLLHGSRPKYAMASHNIWLTTFQISSKSVHFQRSYSQPREGRSKCAIKRFQVLGEAHLLAE